MNKGVIYYTKIREEYAGTHMEHMIAEKLLETALKKEYNIDLKYEPRAEGEHKTYLTGVDGEKYYVKATFDASTYTNPADASGSTDNSNNNINSSGLSMYADVTGGNNYVFRDDTGDEEALAYFRTFNTLASRADICSGNQYGRNPL